MAVSCESPVPFRFAKGFVEPAGAPKVKELDGGWKLKELLDPCVAAGVLPKVMPLLTTPKVCW
jgi:hypothetical protein